MCFAAQGELLKMTEFCDIHFVGNILYQLICNEYF